MDTYSSHYQPDLIQFAKEHEIILFCLPPHNTHESQPLDTAVFGPLKQCGRNACHDYMQAHTGQVITKYNYSAILNKAWMHGHYGSGKHRSVPDSKRGILIEILLSVELHPRIYNSLTNRA